jgi:hypothetical protein
VYATSSADWLNRTLILFQPSREAPGGGAHEGKLILASGGELTRRHKLHSESGLQIQDRRPMSFLMPHVLTA